MTLLEAAAAWRAGRVSSVELTEDCLRRIEKYNPELNAFITVTADSARAAAAQADRERRDKLDRGPLHGIPIAHKDLLCTKGVRTTGGSLIHSDYTPHFDSTAVRRLQDAGAIMIGKTNLHEHAYGITSTNPHYGAVRNPWNPDCIPGGSSGGSAVAVSTGMALMCTGTDTGGSIRVPASFCGIAGIKPTYGLVSRYGVLPLAFSLDSVGPMALTVRDCAAALAVMAGPDPNDPSSAKRPVPEFMPPDSLSLKGLRIGIPENFFYERLDPQVDNAVHFLAYTAEDLGAELVKIRMPDGHQLNAIAQVTILAEAAATHEPYIRRRRSSYGEDVRTLLDMGRAIPAADYLQAQRLRRRSVNVLRSLFRNIDCLLIPATPTGAPKIGQNEIAVGGQTENVRIASTRLVRWVNAVGLPSLSIPAGFTQGGMPIGAQLVGRAFDEPLLFRLGAAIEDATQLYLRQPPILKQQEKTQA